MAPSTSEFVSIFVVLSIPFLYEMSSAFRYHFKFIIYYLYVSTVAIIMIPIMALRPRDCRNAIMASRVCRVISPLLGIDWKLRGKEYFGMEGPCVIVANHQSSLDVLGMFEFWHVMGKCTIVAKKELFYAWPFGLAAWLCGLIFVDRMKSSQAKDIMNTSAQIIKAEKVKMWVFPEGTRKNTGELHSFKKGAFHVAVAAQVPIQPVVFSPFYFLDNEERTLNQGKVIITALPPISTVGFSPEDVDVLMKRVRDIMVKEFNRVSEEIYSSLPVTVTVSCKKSFTRTCTAEENISLTGKEHMLLTDKERVPRTDSQHISLTDTKKSLHTHNEGKTSLTDKAHASGTDSKQKISPYNEKISHTDKAQESRTDSLSDSNSKQALHSHKEKTSLTDRERTSHAEGFTSRQNSELTSASALEFTCISDKNQTSLTDKKQISLIEKGQSSLNDEKQISNSVQLTEKISSEVK